MNKNKNISKSKSKRFLLIVIFFLQLFVLTSCGQNQNEIRYKTASPLDVEEAQYLKNYKPLSGVTLNADYLFYQDLKSTITLKNFKFQHLTLIEKKNWPDWLDFNQEKSELSARPKNFGIYSDISLIFNAEDKVGQVSFGPFSVGVIGDPLKKFSWGLENIGQEVFSFYGGIQGVDINVLPLYEKNIFGSGVKIAISDTGAEKNHDDYFRNFSLKTSKNYRLKKSPYIGNPVPYDPHGTSVTGIIASEGWNNIGTRGVAPKASVSVFQFLYSDQTVNMLIDQASGPYDIFNYSYGDSVFHDIPSNATYVEHLFKEVQTARKGKGKIFIKAAGNDFTVCKNNICASHNANIPLENETPYMMIVGAVNSSGEKSTYSSSGSNIWVVAPGGEDGVLHPAIMTADLPGCKYGYSQVGMRSLGNSFEYNHPLNPTCLYTSMMNGTSSATPFVTGVMALLMNAFPHFSWRDLRHIVAMSAAQVDSDQSGSDHPGGLDLPNYVYEDGWTQNAAGINFHNFYGFGLIDAAKAYDFGQSFAGLPTYQELNHQFNKSEYQHVNLGAPIPDFNPQGLIDTLAINNNLTIEQVQVELDVSHPRSGEVGVELYSPAGTKSILLNINHSLLLSGDANLRNLRLLSNAFYGEQSLGQWKIKIIDGSSKNAGKLNSWKINITGH